MNSAPFHRVRRPRPLTVFGLVALAVLGLVWARSVCLVDLTAAVCNGDGVCSYDELSAKSSPANQPCLDCRSKTYSPLVVLPAEAQIITQGNDPTWSAYKVFQFRSIGTEVVGADTLGIYRDTWASLKTEDKFPSVCTGDADNDGQPEIIAAVNTGKGKRINLYKTGSLGSPGWQSPYFAKTAGSVLGIRVGDVDGDGKNELVMNIGSYIWIYRVERNGSSVSFTFLWTSPVLARMIWTIDIGDGDNDGDNEIVLASSGGNAPVILKYAGTNTWAPQPIEPMSFLGMADVAKVRNVDEYPDNEILVSGNNNKVMIWKHDGSMYRLVAVSQDLGGFTQGVDAGEIDPNLPGNEIATAASGPTGSSIGYVLKFSGGAIQILSSVAIPRSTEYVCAKDLDGDGLCEIGISIYPTGLDIYEYLTADRTLLKRFSCVYGSSFERGAQP